MAGSTFASRSYRDNALILRTRNLGEADRIITMLTAEHGLVRGVAKGVRRTSSKFGATLEPFMVADVQLVHGRSLDIVTQAVSKGAYGAMIVADYEKYTSAHIMAEAAERLTESDPEDSRPQFRLLHGALSALARGVHAPDLVLNSYLLRALSTAGWAVTWTACVACGRPGPQPGFHAGLGGPVCPDCRPPGTRTLAPATTDLLHALQHGSWQSASEAAPEARHEASSVVTSYVQHHLERRLSSLG
ncbi:DNA repair protein RecO [Nesterenkonia sp. CL21]|uniref:DNA repair protein RecO n=1 Tax=Nesterenkonia sp. CL21 TaxID=3064894 RepID=UPI002879101E|nr:DNA repair protein RecO [Nesterenkonia sp. CL21]MDS2171726.1 DNA repair protein RecO [Nesterenkonia sp. CL21]